MTPETLTALRDLLAVIHRDGGQHTGRHGLEQSASDAREAVAAALAERDELRAQVGAIRGALIARQQACCEPDGSPDEQFAYCESCRRDMAALSTPPPPVVDREKVRQIAEALRKAHHCDCPGHWKEHSPACPIGQGLAIARELGLLEDK